MNILGINGSIGWDGNIGFLTDFTHQDYWVHGSGATLFVDGELKGSLSEERLTRLKHDGGYPKNVIEQLLLRNNLTEDNIDMVAYVSNPCMLGYSLKLQGHTNKELSSIFPNASIMFVDHHLAHASASFLSSGFSEANIFSFDGAGDFHPVPVRLRLNNSVFYNGYYDDKEMEPVQQTFLDDDFNLFGSMYTEFSSMIYELKTGTNKKPHEKSVHEETEKTKAKLNLSSFSHAVDMTDYEYDFDDKMTMGPILRETHPGKIMGLSSYGDYTNVDVPDIFNLMPPGQGEEMPIIHCNQSLKRIIINRSENNEFSAEDLANWLQHQFEKYLLLYLRNVNPRAKLKKLCLAGGCALNIISNSKIIDEGIYEDVHVNTAPNDDGLNFGAAIYCAWQNEKDLILPENIGCIGFDYPLNNIEEYENKI